MDFPNLPHLEVVGKSEFYVEPDMAIVTAELKSICDSASGAKTEVDAKASAVIELARACSITTEYIAATKLTIQPEYDWQGDKRISVGTAVSREVTLTLTELENLEQLVQGLANIPVYQIRRLELDVSDRAEMTNSATAKAIQDARKQALYMSKELNVELGRVFRVNQVSGHSYRDRYSADCFMLDGAGSPSFETGLITVSVELAIIYLIADDSGS